RPVVGGPPPHPLTHLLGQHRPTVEMAAHTLGQIHTTARAEVDAVTEKLGAQFLMPEVLGAGGTLRRRVPPAVPEEKSTLLGAQIMRSQAVNMGHAVADQLDGIVGRDHLHASRASPLDHFSSTAS